MTSSVSNSCGNLIDGARTLSGSLRGKVLPFFKQVWPKQRALHTPVMSSHLANFALDSGDLMPAVVELILPRLCSNASNVLAVSKLRRGN